MVIIATLLKNRTEMPDAISGLTGLDPAKSLHTLVEPEVFRQVYLVSKLSLSIASGNRLVRDRVADLANSFRQASLQRFGHEVCMEANALGALLRDTDYGRPEEPKETTVERLHRLDTLTGDEMRAAQLIEQVWGVFERFLGARSAQIGQGGSGRGYLGVPSMGSDLTHRYVRYYTPWYAACRNRPHTMVGTRKLRPVDVVLQFVVQHQPLKRMADAYGVRQQDLIDLLRGELISLASRMEDDDQSGAGESIHATSTGTGA